MESQGTSDETALEDPSVLESVEEALQMARLYLSEMRDTPGEPHDTERARAVLVSTLERIKPPRPPTSLPEPIQQAAILLATSWITDSEINPERATDEALRTLSEWFDLRTTDDAEALASAADIHVSRWDRSAQWRELRRALYLYERAKHGRWGPSSDPLLEKVQVGLHAAFLLDTLARQEEQSLHHEESTWSQRVPVVDENGGALAPTAPAELGNTALTLRKDARELRKGLVEQLDKAERGVIETYELTDPEQAEELEDKKHRVWRFYLQLAEAHVGLRDYEAAKRAIKAGARYKPRSSERTLQTTARRFIELARLRGIRPGADRPTELIAGLSDEDLATALEMHKTGASYDDIASKLRLTSADQGREAVVSAGRQGSRQVVEALLESEDRDMIHSAFKGKLGLALSGGGFRASLFHVGVLAQLAEQGLLPELEAISCVSGGSILGTQYYLLVKELLESNTDDELRTDSRAAFIDIVQRLVEHQDVIIRKNLRARIFANPFATAGLWRSSSRRVGKLLRRHVLPQVKDLSTGRPVTDLRDIQITPKDWREEQEKKPNKDRVLFRPRRHNWQRMHKVPVLILNATSLNTGHNWQFTSSHVGEPPALVHPEIDSGAHLGRAKLSRKAEPNDPAEVTDSDWNDASTSPSQPEGDLVVAAEGTVDVPITLGEAVAASAALPGLFQPLQVARLYPDWLLKLADGGVVDNQGIGGLLEQGVDTVLISDASRQLASSPAPAGGVVPALRSNSIAYHRIRAAQYDELRTRRRSGLVRDVMFVHLNRDLLGPKISPHGTTGGSPAIFDDEPEPTRKRRRGIRPKRAARRLRPPDWTQQMVLSVLSEGGAMTYAEVHAKISDVPGGAVWRALGSLAARELIEEVPNSDSYRIGPTGLQRAKVPVTSYGISRSMQNSLARTRTDLNTFTQAEAHALMTSGYLMTRQALRERNGIGPYTLQNESDATDAERTAPDAATMALDTDRWRFLRIAKVMGSPNADLAEYQYALERHLAKSSKSMRLPSKSFMGGVTAVALLAVVLLAFTGWVSPLGWVDEVFTSEAIGVPIPRLLLPLMIGAIVAGGVMMVLNRLAGRAANRPLSVLAKVSLLAVGLVLAVVSWMTLIYNRLTPNRGNVGAFLPPENR